VKWSGRHGRSPHGAAPTVREATLATALREGARLAGRCRLAVPRESMRGGNGTRQGTQSGVSLDFRDYREYAPGDDLRHIDWNVVARTERYVVKLFREEVFPHLDLVLDVSRSMALPGTDKAVGALRLAALLAGAAARASCTWTLWHAGAQCRPDPVPGRGIEGPRQPPRFEAVESPAAGIAAGSGPFKRNGMRVFISDLLWPGDPMQVLWPLADRATSLHVIQWLAASEEDPGATGNLRLHDVERGVEHELFADAATLERYRDGLRSHRTVWRDACRRCGARFLNLTADLSDPEGLLTALQRHGLIE